MNVKKMFASLTGVLMLAQLAPVAVLGAALYGAELEGAYKYAFEKGITTMASIDSANMYGKLTRGQLAKMISNWAEAELGQKADATKVCSFTDESKAEGDLAMYVKKACQMGLMGQGIAEFRPNAKVTRGEFGTTLSRALWGDKYNTTANPYYINHLAALKDAGIMNMIETPNELEMRGYVMLMLQRAVASKNTANCADPVIALACQLGGENCPAACKTGKDNKETNNSSEARGDLNVSVAAHNGTVSIPNAGTVDLGSLDFTASEDVTLHSLDVTRLGLSSNSGLKAWIEKDGRRISSSSSFFGDSKANLVFNGGYVLKKNEKLNLVVSLTGVTAGSEMAFKIDNVKSSAKNTVVSPDTTGLYRTAVYAATSLDFTAVSSDQRNYNVAKTTQFSFGEFRVQNEAGAKDERNVLIKSIAFKVDGDLERLSDFQLLRNGKKIETTAKVDGKYVIFSMNDTIDSGRNATYKILATPLSIEREKGDSYTFSIRRAEDVIAQEIGASNIGYRVVVKGADKMNLGATKVAGGLITFARDVKFPSTVNANWGYSDVVVAKGTLKVNQDVVFNGFTVTEAATVGTYTNIDLTKAVRRAELVIDGKSYGLTVGADTLSTNAEIHVARGTKNIELKVSLYTETQATVNFKPNALTTKLEFVNISANAIGAKSRYLNSDETTFAQTQVVGALNVAKVNIAQQYVGFKKVGSSDEVKVSLYNTDERVIFSGELFNNLDKTVEVSKINLLGASKNIGAGTEYAKVFVRFGDGTTTSTYTLKAGTTAIDGYSTAVEAGKTVKFEVVVIPNGNLGVNDKFTTKVSVESRIEGNTLGSADLSAANVIIVPVGGSATVVATNSTANTAKVILPGVATEVSTFNYNVKNDSKDLTKMDFAIAGMKAKSSVDSVTVCFDDICPANKSEVNDAKDTLTVTFLNTLTLQPKNYKVRVNVAFNEDQITHASLNTEMNKLALLNELQEALTKDSDVTNNVTAEQAKAKATKAYTGNLVLPATKTAIDNIVANDADATLNAAITAVDGEIETATTALATARSAVVNRAVEFRSVDFNAENKPAVLSDKHWVARNNPFLSVKEKNTTENSERLDVNVKMINDNNALNLIKINTVNPAHFFNKTSGATGKFENVGLSTADAVARSSKQAGVQVKSVTFEVIEDNGNVAIYEDVTAGNVADFASLAL